MSNRVFPCSSSGSSKGPSDWERETLAVNVYFDRAHQLATIRDAVPIATIMAQVQNLEEFIFFALALN